MRPNPLSPVLALLPLLVGCAPVVVIWDGGDITQDTTWSGNILVENGFDVNARLVIEPCARIEMGSGVLVHVRDGGSIVAQGTEDCPIVFTSALGAPAAGDWQRFDLWSTSSNDNVFEHVAFEWAGPDLYGAVWVESGATVAFRDVSVIGTTDDGLHFEPDARIEDFTRVDFDEIGGHPVHLGMRAAGAVADVAVTGSVADPRILVVPSTLTQDVTFSALAVPYEVDSQEINAGWTLDPGATVQLAPGALVHVREGGALRAVGTADAPVIIESAKDAPAAGDWARFDLWDSSSNANVLEHAVVRHGGSDPTYGAIWLEGGASVDLTSVVFEENDGCDVYAPQDADVGATDAPFVNCVE